MFPAVGLTTFCRPDIMPEPKLISFQDELLCDLFKFFELYPLEISQLAVAQKRVIRFSFWLRFRSSRARYRRGAR